MAKTGYYYHFPATAGNVTGVTTTYSASRRLAIALGSSQPAGQTVKFKGKLQTLLVTVSTIAGTPAPTQMTIRVSSDTAGDSPITGDLTASLARGITTNTVGSAQFDLSDVVTNLSSTDNVFVHFRVNQGTLTVTGMTLSWSE